MNSKRKVWQHKKEILISYKSCKTKFNKILNSSSKKIKEFGLLNIVKKPKNLVKY